MNVIDPKDFMSVHKDMIVIDGCSPLPGEDRNPKYFEWYLQGGVTAVAPTVAEGAMQAETDSVHKDQVLDVLGYFHRQIQTRDDVLLVRKADDVYTAKKEGKLGIFLHLQGASCVEYNLDLVNMYKGAGVGVIQLTYNVRNQFGNGILEPRDDGLSTFGIELVKRLNEAKIIVDVAHTGPQTSLDAVKHSSAPVIISHANARGALDNIRNAPDEVIKAVAKSGGFCGAVMYPAFVSKAPRPSLEDYIRHIDYLVELVGIDHVAIGADYFSAQWGVMSDEDAQKIYERYLAVGAWTKEAYPPPPWVYPKGVETPKTWFNLTGGLLKRGYSVEDVRKLLGGNWLRVMKAVWG